MRVHPVVDRAERQSVRMSKVTNLVWQRMLYSCTSVATVGVKGLNSRFVP